MYTCEIPKFKIISENFSNEMSHSLSEKFNITIILMLSCPPVLECGIHKITVFLEPPQLIHTVHTFILAGSTVADSDHDVFLIVATAIYYQPI
jgi:hypothetical protein